MGMRIVDRDRGYNALVKKVFAQRKPILEVGVLSSASGNYAGGTSIVDVATWNEFGTSRIPSRSFLRAWFDEGSDRAREWLSSGMKAVIKGKTTADKMLEMIGLKIVGEIQTRMASSIPPPNAPSTVAKKGSTTTLIDTGQLRSSISSRVKG